MSLQPKNRTHNIKNRYNRIDNEKRFEIIFIFSFDCANYQQMHDDANNEENN